MQKVCSPGEGRRGIAEKRKDVYVGVCDRMCGCASAHACVC